MYDLTICVVGTETLEVTDGNSGMTHLEMDTLRLALFLLRADTSTDSWQRRTLFDDRSGTEHVSCLEGLDEARDVDIDRTALYTSRVLTVETTVRLGDGLLESQALVHLFV